MSVNFVVHSVLLSLTAVLHANWQVPQSHRGNPASPLQNLPLHAVLSHLVAAALQPNVAHSCPYTCGQIR